VLAVGQNGLALVEQELPAGPVDVVAHAVGDVKGLIAVEANDADAGEVEAGIVQSHHRIVVNGAA